MAAWNGGEQNCSLSIPFSLLEKERRKILQVADCFIIITAAAAAKEWQKKVQRGRRRCRAGSICPVFCLRQLGWKESNKENSIFSAFTFSSVFCRGAGKKKKKEKKKNRLIWQLFSFYFVSFSFVFPFSFLWKESLAAYYSAVSIWRERNCIPLLFSAVVSSEPKEQLVFPNFFCFDLIRWQHRFVRQQLHFFRCRTLCTTTIVWSNSAAAAADDDDDDEMEIYLLLSAALSTWFDFLPSLAHLFFHFWASLLVQFSLQFQLSVFPVRFLAWE